MSAATFAAAQVLRLLPRTRITRVMGRLADARVPAPLASAAGATAGSGGSSGTAPGSPGTYRRHTKGPSSPRAGDQEDTQGQHGGTLASGDRAHGAEYQRTEAGGRSPREAVEAEVFRFVAGRHQVREQVPETTEPFGRERLDLLAGIVFPSLQFSTFFHL